MFPKRLRKLRKEKGLTMKELGKKFNLAESTISGYENGVRKPDIEQLEKFAAFFDVSIDFLLGRTDNRDLMAWDKRSKEEIKELRDLFVNSDEPLAIDGDLVTEEEREYFYELLKVAKKRAQKQKEE